MNVIISRIFTKTKSVKSHRHNKWDENCNTTNGDGCFRKFYDECIKHKGNKGNKTIGAIVKEILHVYLPFLTL